jgi:signal transduction histidine kinase
MRIAAVMFLLALVGLTVSSVAWLRVANAPSTGVIDSETTLATFEATQRADAIEIDVGTLYSGRTELLDPKQALPNWHKHARDAAVRVHMAESQCPPPQMPELADASLAKAYAWHAQTCSESGTPLGNEDDIIERPPLLHPSGSSYAALAFARGSRPAAWVQRHVRAFHVLELAALDQAALSASDRALAALPGRAWEQLGRGDALVLTDASLVIATHGPLGLTKLRIHPRAAFENFIERAGAALVPRRSAAFCATPASPELCWEPVPMAKRHRAARLFSIGLSAALMLLSSCALGFGYVRERRSIHRDRVHVLRTLTHELRTPATNLLLDIEPLRAAYDELPSACQEPLLRLSDGVERLHRVLHRSARYLALFETSGLPRQRLVKLREVSSANALFEELREDWPEHVSLVAGAKDGPLRTDPEWLGVALKNLVENGVRHGKPPFVVTWSLDNDELLVRVADGGRTPDFSLRKAVAPFARADESPGLGLGLAIVERVSKLLGGKLTHEPSPTVFQLRIPSGGPT